VKTLWWLFFAKMLEVMLLTSPVSGGCGNMMRGVGDEESAAAQKQCWEFSSLSEIFAGAGRRPSAAPPPSFPHFPTWLLPLSQQPLCNLDRRLSVGVGSLLYSFFFFC
jgi:hypothetical protein